MEMALSGGSGKTGIIMRSVARLIDIASVLDQLPRKTDAEALAADWNQVGEDLRAAISVAQRDLPEQERLPEQLELVEAR